eukprot:TRINITY_DN4318_c0_g2_i11.p1 TRINITY_DN4318_c0_g2~~TRINITY_DN4318_c0_g2_i11.p1  ORF type:complete len:413 (+),score=54.02 TRINITY_DN4318_c0_g2_i11:62-1300(+)
MGDSVYTLNTQLNSTTNEASLLFWITNTLIPFISKGTGQGNMQDSLVVNALKKAVIMGSVDVVKCLLNYACDSCERVGVCNVLWHFGEWVESVQGMIFETKIEISPTLKSSLREVMVSLIDKSKEKLLKDLVTKPTGIKVIHYLNLHLFLTESLMQYSPCASVISFFTENAVEINKLIELNPKLTGIRVKLFIVLSNVIKFNSSALLSPKAFTESSSLLIDNKLFAELFVTLTNSLSIDCAPMKFADRERAIRSSVTLNYALSLLVFGMHREDYEWAKVAALYHQFFDSKKEQIIHLMTISDSSLISFLLHVTSLNAVTEAKSIPMFKTQWIALEYISSILSQYGVEEWCEMSINYLLEDAQYLEFMVQLLDYLKSSKAEIIKVKYISIYTFIARLKAVSYTHLTLPTICSV